MNYVPSKGVRAGESCAGTMMSSEACRLESDVGVSRILTNCGC